MRNKKQITDNEQPVFQGGLLILFTSKLKNMNIRIEIFPVNDVTDVALVYSTGEERNELMTLTGVSGDGKPITIVKPEPFMTLNTLKKCLEEDTNIKCVYVWTLSELSHSSEELTKIADLLKSKSIQLVVNVPTLKMFDENGNYTYEFSMLAEMLK